MIVKFQNVVSRSMEPQRNLLPRVQIVIKQNLLKKECALNANFMVGTIKDIVNCDLT